jgi:hypothetical protein
VIQKSEEQFDTTDFMQR